MQVLISSRIECDTYPRPFCIPIRGTVALARFIDEIIIGIVLAGNEATNMYTAAPPPPPHISPTECRGH